MLQRRWPEMWLFGLAGIVVGGTVAAVFASGLLGDRVGA